MRTGLDWTPAKCLIRTNRSTRDSPLEREGFEPLVPPEKGRASASPPRRFGETGRACLSATSGDRFLELDFGGEAGAMTPDRQHRQFAAALSVSHRAVLRRKASIGVDPVPFRGVPEIVELQIVLLGPEERHRAEALARPEHVAGSCLALPFGDDPVLDADRLASQPVGPAGDIAGGPDAGGARLEIRVDGDTAVNSNPGFLGERGLRPHPDPDDDEVGIELFATLQCDAVWIERSCGGTEVERDAVLLVDLAYEVSDFRAKDCFHRPRLGCHDVHRKPARPQ